MADAKYSSSDIPNFDTYPSPSPQARAPETLPVDQPAGLLAQPRLEEIAVQLGASVGQIVRLLRDRQEVAQRKLSEITEEATAALNQRAETVKTQTEDIRRVARDKAQELWVIAEQRANEVREQVVRNLKQAQIRAREIQRDHPERVAMGAGVLGVALGVGLRIWRSSRAA